MEYAPTCSGGPIMAPCASPLLMLIYADVMQYTQYKWVVWLCTVLHKSSVNNSIFQNDKFSILIDTVRRGY